MLVVGAINKQVDKENENDLALEMADDIKREVLHRVLQSDKYREVRTDSITAGPSRHDPNSDVYNDKEAAFDGSVTVYGVWAVKQGEGSRASKSNN